MINVPYPQGIKADSDTPKAKESLTNLMNVGGAILKTPGIDAFTTGQGRCRGASMFKGLLYQVSGDKLISVAADGVVVVIGDVDGTADVVFVVGNVFLTIVVKNGKGYTYNAANGLEQIMDAEYVPSDDAAILDGFVVYVPSDGGPLFFGEVGAPQDIRPLSFFDAELLPDVNTGIIALNNDLYGMGEDSGELFRHTGPADSPFLRVGGGAVQTGYVSGKTLFKTSFVFLGKSRGGTYTFNVMGQGDAPAISNEAIEEILNEEYTPAELKLCSGSRIRWKNTDIAIFNLPRHTFMFSGGWSYLASGMSAPDVTPAWTANHPVFAYGDYVVGDEATGRIGKLSDSITEYGDPIIRQVETFARDKRNTNFTLDSLEIDALTGQKTPEGNIGLAMSNDGLNYGEMFWIGMGKVGEYRQRISWDLPGGLGDYENYAGIRIRTTADVNFSSEAMYVTTS